MNQYSILARKALSAVLWTTMLAIWISVPFLEQADLVHDPIIESEHSSSTCPPAHDHTVCTQVVANLAAPSSGTLMKQKDFVVWDPSLFETDVPLQFTFAQGHRARGPPLA